MSEYTSRGEKDLSSKLGDLIADVRHGDDCTASDLADRLLRGGLVDLVKEYNT